jgi:hypothetical protein
MRKGQLRCPYKCAPSESAMNGNKDQSFSAAGSVPSGPMHSSISGPLYTQMELVHELIIVPFLSFEAHPDVFAELHREKDPSVRTRR